MPEGDVVLQLVGLVGVGGGGGPLRAAEQATPGGVAARPPEGGFRVAPALVAHLQVLRLHPLGIDQLDVGQPAPPKPIFRPSCSYRKDVVHFPAEPGHLEGSLRARETAENRELRKSILGFDTHSMHQDVDSIFRYWLHGLSILFVRFDG